MSFIEANVSALLLVRHIGIERAPAQCSLKLSTAHLHTAHESIIQFWVFPRVFKEIFSLERWLEARKCLKTLNLSLSNIIRVTRENWAEKKKIFDLAMSDFYPPEGHSCTNLLAVNVQGQAQNDDTKK